MSVAESTTVRDVYLEVDGRTASYATAVNAPELRLDQKDSEAEKVVKKAEPATIEPAQFKELFRYTTPRQRRLLWVATACSLLQGAGMPMWTMYVQYPIGGSESFNDQHIGSESGVCCCSHE